jgi:hypothetical protein
MEERKEALKNQKIGKLFGKDNLNSELYKYLGDVCNENITVS